MIVDVIVDLQYGDCGKGKVTHYLCKAGKYTHMVVNKMDVMREIDCWKLFSGENLHEFTSEAQFQEYFYQKLSETGISIYFSGDKAKI